METRVSLHAAKMLKALGFRDKTKWCYDKCDIMASHDVERSRDYNDSAYCVSAPDIIHAAKWLFVKTGRRVEYAIYPDRVTVKTSSDRWSFYEEENLTSEEDYLQDAFDFAVNTAYTLLK